MALDVRIDRAIELKAELVVYALEPRFHSGMGRIVEEIVDHPGEVDEQVALTAIELLLYGPRPDGRPPVIDHYLRRHPDLPAADRALLQDWLDRGLFGLFAIAGRRGDRLTLTNLHDELGYEVVVSMGASAAKQAARAAWTATRVVPVDDIWLQRGALRLYGPEEGELVGEALVTLIRTDPAGAFRNPDKLAQARRTVRSQHDVFCEMFDGALTVGTGAEILERYRAFLAACDVAVDDAADQEPAVDDAIRMDDGLAPWLDEPVVAMAHHPVKSVVLLGGFTVVERCYAAPMAALDDAARQHLLDYLDDETVPAWVFHELARRHPDTVDALYQAVLDQPGFSWTRDGDVLLRAHEPASFVDMDVPDLLVLPPLAARAARRIG